MKQPYQHPDVQATSILDLELQGKLLIDLVQNILLKGVNLRLHARGSSMTPFIRDGDLITIRPINNRNTGIGDIVAFIHPDSENLILHRVIVRKQNVVVVKGDNENRSQSDQITHQAIIGILQRVERGGHLTRLGMGPEKVVISWMSRLGLLVPVRLWFARLRGRS